MNALMCLCIFTLHKINNKAEYKLKLVQPNQLLDFDINYKLSYLASTYLAVDGNIQFETELFNQFSNNLILVCYNKIIYRIGNSSTLLPQNTLLTGIFCYCQSNKHDVDYI